MTDLSLLFTGLCAFLCMGGTSVQGACGDFDLLKLFGCMNENMGQQHVETLLAQMQNIQSADSSDIVGALLANLEFKDLEKVTGAVCKFIETYDAIKQCVGDSTLAGCSEHSYFISLHDGYDILIQENITLLCEPRCLVLPACVNAINETLIGDILPAYEAKTQGSPYDADKLQRDCDVLKENLECGLPLLNVCPGYIVAYGMIDQYLDSIEKDICKFNVSYLIPTELVDGEGEAKEDVDGDGEGEAKEDGNTTVVSKGTTEPVDNNNGNNVAGSTTTTTRTTTRATNNANDNGNETSGADCKLYDIMSMLTVYILLYTTFL